jgi:PAB-dependent poly(A)-specific ribonuclease subunit 2
MPYYKEPLLSIWPNHLASDVGAPVARLDAEILAKLQPSQIGTFAPNPQKTRRNQIDDTRQAEKLLDSLTAPKFLSEKARAVQSTDGERKPSETFETLTSKILDEVTKQDIPYFYANVEIKYSKFGVDDFDFA